MNHRETRPIRGSLAMYSNGSGQTMLTLDETYNIVQLCCFVDMIYTLVVSHGGTSLGIMMDHLTPGQTLPHPQL